MPTANTASCFLFDNGSLRADATRSLRKVAAALTERLGKPVRPVSLLHSSGVNPQHLDGRPAELLEPALDAFLTAGGREALLLPLFFGPSAALTDYLPTRLAALRTRHPQALFRLADALVRADERADTRIAQALADAVRARQAASALGRVPVILVDHGTPQPAVTEIREHLGGQLQRELGDVVSIVGTASMERREGPEYAFNEPLLEHALRQPPFNTGDVIIALQFLAPGRHAGAEGDIAAICSAAEAAQPGLRTHATATLGAHPQVIAVLADRFRAAASL